MEYRLQNYCDVCRKKFEQWEWIIIKLPERIYFCIDCASKKEDNKKSTWMATTYEDGSILEHFLYDNR